MDNQNKPTIKKGMKKSTKWIIFLSILFLAVAGFGVWKIGKNQKTIDALHQKAADLQPDTALVERGDLMELLDEINGTVRSNQSVYLYWQTSGTVSDVNVAVGDPVKKGDVLAELDLSTVDSSVIDAIVTKENAEEKLERLYTSTLELEQKRSAVVTAKQEVDDAQDVVNNQEVVREDQLELGVKYDDWQKSIINYDKAVENWEALRVRPVDDVDRQRAVSQLENAKSTMDSAKAQYNWYNGYTDSNEVQQADANLKLAQAKLADAERAYDRIKDGPTETQVSSIKAEINAADATIETSKIVSPIDGVVAQVKAKPFDVISYESNSAERNILAVRVDDTTSHYIDISVSELDINKISLGQKVSITFDAIPLRNYTGTVTNISNAGTISDLTVNYSLTVKMDEVDDSIKSGMMADVAIVVDIVEDCLYVPAQAVMKSNHHSGRVVKRLNPNNGAFEEVIVQVGPTFGSNVQVISPYLKEGDSVQLPKTEISVSKNPFKEFGLSYGTGNSEISVGRGNTGVRPIGEPPRR